MPQWRRSVGPHRCDHRPPNSRPAVGTPFTPCGKAAQRKIDHNVVQPLVRQAKKAATWLTKHVVQPAWHNYIHPFYEQGWVPIGRWMADHPVLSGIIAGVGCTILTAGVGIVTCIGVGLGVGGAAAGGATHCGNGKTAGECIQGVVGSAVKWGAVAENPLLGSALFLGGESLENGQLPTVDHAITTTATFLALHGAFNLLKLSGQKITSNLIERETTVAEGRLTEALTNTTATDATHTTDNLITAGTPSAPGSGPVTFRPPPGATADEIAQVRAYVEGCNAALCAGQLSPTGRVSTQGALRADASRAAAVEHSRAAAASSPYLGHAGHVPDTTWTGSASPPAWMDLTPRVNTSLGGQSVHYPIGYRPTLFEFLDP
jgi:hypothetical protein